MSKVRKVTEGGRRLADYLRRRGLSISAWSEQTDFCRITAQKIINGEQYSRISVDKAYEIQVLTKGYVKVTHFRSNTAIPVA